MRIVPLDFLSDGGFFQPKDRELHDKAEAFAKRQIVGEVNFVKFNKVWVAMENGEVVGLAAYVTRADVPLFRTVTDRATTLIAHRLNDFFCDQGMRGQEVLLHLSSKETPEQRCANWQKELEAAGAVPADRFSVVVK